MCTDVGTLTRGMPVVMNWRSTVCALASETSMDNELGFDALWQKARRILTMQGDPSRPETQLRAAALNVLLHVVEMTIENLFRERQRPIEPLTNALDVVRKSRIVDNGLGSQGWASGRWPRAGDSGSEAATQ